MTVAEAEEKLETLTRNLASSEISLSQRHKYEAQVARCHRFIQRARQKAHRSLASFAETLLGMAGDTVFDQNQNAALITAAHLIRCASIEQLAIAVPAAIRETPTNSTRPAGFKCPEFTETAECLLGMDNSTFSCECNVAIQTALQLSNIVGWQQIHQSVRRAQADSSELGPKGIVNRLTEICSAYHPKKPASTPRLTDSQKAISLSTVPVSESHL
jgi:hypothetical protein